MTQVTLSLPDELATRLASFEEQLPQIIERGLERLEGAPGQEFADLRDVLEKLATLPDAHEVLQLRPSPKLQSRLAELLDKDRGDGLTDAEEREVAQFEYIEHLLRLAKGRARQKLGEG
jgi:hypothetical protein